MDYNDNLKELLEKEYLRGVDDGYMSGFEDGKNIGYNIGFEKGQDNALRYGNT